jgi:TonB family protein
VVADGPGVSVDTGGAALMHRPSVAYPAAALAGRIEGTMVVQATVDSAGNVTDASVLSGPEELRKTAIQSVFQFHFVRGGSNTHQVILTFHLPVENSQPAKPRVIEQELPPPNGPSVPAGRVIVSGQVALPPAGSPEFQALMAQQQALSIQLRDASASRDQQAMMDIMSQMRELNEKRLASEKIRTITVTGLSDQIRSELLASLPIREGDAPTTENMAKLKDAVKQFDEHLLVSLMATGSPDEVEIRIAVPGSEPAGRIMVGGQVQEPNLTNKVNPVYPPLARSAGIQGAVVLAIVIGKDGSVQEIKLVSGHPLLAPAAIAAVKQWTYKPLTMNGQPVEVSTQVTVNFALAN